MNYMFMYAYIHICSRNEAEDLTRIRNANGLALVKGFMIHFFVFWNVSLHNFWYKFPDDRSRLTSRFTVVHMNEMNVFDQ